jgi:hypothetical protein
MIIVIVHDAQTNQANVTFEPSQPEMAAQLLTQMGKVLTEQISKKPRLIVPPTAIPTDFMKRNGEPPQ